MKYGDVLTSAKDFFERSFTSGHTVEIKFKVAGPKFSNFSVDKVEVASKGTFKTETTFKGVTDGLDVTFALEDGTAASGKRSSAKVGADFATDAFSASVDVDIPNGPAVTAGGVFATHDAFIGAQAKFDASQLAKGAGAFSAYDFLVGYKAGGFTGGVEVGGKLSTVTVSGIQNGAAGSVAAAAKVPVDALGKSGDKKGAKKVIEGVDIQLGASRKISASPTLLLSADLDLSAIGRDVHSVS